MLSFAFPVLFLKNWPAMCLCSTQCCVEENISCLVSAELVYKEWVSGVQLLSSQSPCCQMQNSDNLEGNAPQKSISALVQGSGKSLSRHFKTSVLRPLYTCVSSDPMCCYVSNPPCPCSWVSPQTPEGPEYCRSLNISTLQPLKIRLLLSIV